MAPIEQESMPAPAGFDESIRRRVAKGVGANAVGQLLNIASKFVLVPIFLAFWGGELYGEWLVLSAAGGYLSLSELGAQLYVVNRLTQAFARKDYAEFRVVLHTGMAVFLLAPAVFLVVFGAAAVLLDVDSLLGITKMGGGTGRLVLLLLALQVGLSMPLGLLLGVYRASGMYARGMMLANVLQLIQITVTVIALTAGAGPLGVAPLLLLPPVLVAGMGVYAINRNYPEFQVLSFRGANPAAAIGFVKPSLHFLAIQVSQALSVQGLVLVVGAILGSIQVVMFTTVRTVINAIMQFQALLTTAAWADMTRLDVAGDSARLVTLFRVLLRTTMVITVFFVALLELFGQELFGFWLRGGVPYDGRLVTLFLVYVTQLAFWTACSHVLMAINAHFRLARMMLVSATLTVILAALGSYRYGLYGAVGGMLIADLLMPLWFVPYLLRRACRSFTPRFFAGEAAPVILGLAGLQVAPPAALLVVPALFVWWLRCVELKQVMAAFRR
jgi:O-antigen/teichoic acid export membrane protein